MFCWRASGRLDLASRWLQRKYSPSAVFTFASEYPLCGSCSLGRPDRFRTGAFCGSCPLGHTDRYQTLTFCYWCPNTASGHSVGLQGNRLCWTIKSSEFILSFSKRYIVLFNPFLSWSISLLITFHYWLNILQYGLLKFMVSLIR